MVYRNEKHQKDYESILSRMNINDCYHRSLAYLLALDTVLFEHVEALYDFHEDGIKLEGLHKGFQTGTSKKTTRLAFNLWNGCADEGTHQLRNRPQTPVYRPSIILLNKFLTVLPMLHTTGRLFSCALKWIK